MTEKEKVSKLSKLLEHAEQQVRRCDELDPWGGVETRAAFLQAASVGAVLIAGLYQIDQRTPLRGNQIIGKSRRLKALSQLDLDSLPKLKPPKTKESSKQWSRTWGQALEVTADLEAAAKFCASLAEKEKRWSKGQDYRIEFKVCSEKLAGSLLYDILDVLAEYEPEEYPLLRLQVLCSYLKELRVEFLWDAHVRGPCRTDSIPGQCKFGKLPENLKGQLVASHGDDRHKFIFRTDAGQEFECLINNIGLKNYRALLDDTWDMTTGKLHSYPQDGSAVWAVPGREHIQNLEAYASLISRLLQPLSALPKHSECARAVRAIIRKGRDRWTKRSHIEWPYLHNLDRVIADLGKEFKT
jgi:hypothetical protein